MSIMVNGFGAYAGGIVRVHNHVVDSLASEHSVVIASAPRGQAEIPGVVILSQQVDSRARSVAADLIASKQRIRVDLRIDSAPALRLNVRARRHVVIVHDLNFLNRRVHQISWRQVVYRQLLHRWTFRRVDQIVTVSSSTRAEIEAFLPAAASKTLVMPLPVTHLPATTPRVVTSLPPRVLLSFGHARNKGVDRILKLMGDRPDLSLRVVCSVAQWRAFWANLAEQLGVADRITVLESLTDTRLVEEYRLCDVFCMLSTYEGYGLPVAEAMAQGTPTVISDRPVLRETSRGFAVVAPDADLDGLAAAIERAKTKPPDHWTRAAAAFSKWTWPDFAAALVTDPS